MSTVTDFFTATGSANLAGGSTGWALKKRIIFDGENSEPDKLVSLTDDPGGSPQIKTAHGIGDSAMEYPGVQFTVRAEPNKGDDAQAKAQAILDYFHGKTNETIGSRSYMRVVSQTSEPISAGFDDKKRPLFTVNLRATRLRQA